MTEFDRGQKQGLVRAAALVADHAARFEGDDLMACVRAFLLALRADVLRLAHTGGNELCSIGPCSRCKAFMSTRGYPWGYGHEASGVLCETCFSAMDRAPKPWIATHQRPHEWMRGDT